LFICGDLLHYGHNINVPQKEIKKCVLFNMKNMLHFIEYVTEISTSMIIDRIKTRTLDKYI